MDVKAIVLDMDGTLLTSERVISPATKEALIKAQQQGIKVILASGRPTNGMIEAAHELLMDEYNGYLVSYNGAMVTDFTTKEVVFNQTIPLDLAKEILDHLEDFDVKPMINTDTHMYVNDVFDNNVLIDGADFNIIEYESRGGNFLLREATRLSEILDFPLNKILVAGNPDYLQENIEAIATPYLDRVTGAFSATVYYEFTAKNIDKARALDAVFPDLGITAANTIAFGDGQNDLSIINYAGLGVAMGNGVDEVKAAADEVTLTNDEDGISRVVNRYLS